ncbi:MAG: TolC family protein [Salinivirgaceae bacterium]
MNRLKLILFLAIIAGLGSKITQAQTDSTYRFSLSQALEYAIGNNQSILNANLDVEAAKQKVWEITTIGLPQASANISGSYSPVLSASIESFSSLGMLGQWMYGADQALRDLTSDPKFGNIPDPGPPEPVNTDDMKWSLSGTATVSQLIFSGSYLVGLQSAKVYKSLSELNRVKSIQDITESIKNSYFNVLIARENMLILDSTYQNLSKTLSDMEAIGKQGLLEETDVDQMRITLSNVKISLDLITRLADIADRLFKIQLGIDFNSNLVLTDNLDNLVNLMSYESLLLADLVLDDNVTYQMLDAQVKATELQLKLTKSAFLPDLAAFYQYQKEFNENAFSFTPPHIIGVGMNIPIFSSGMRLSKVKQAKIELMKTQNNQEQMGDYIRLDFYNNKSALIAARDKYQAESKNMDLSKRILNKSMIKFSNGVISSTELTQIQNQYLTTQSNYYQSLQELISSKNKLEKFLSKTEY